MYYGKEVVRLEDVPEPERKPGTIKIHPAFTGICGSNVHLYYDGAVNGGRNSPDHPHPQMGETLPVVFGHEISGTVETIADDHADAIKLIHDRNFDLSTFITDRIKVKDIADKGFRQLREDTG